MPVRKRDEESSSVSQMRRRVAVGLAWSLGGLSVAMLVACVALLLLTIKAGGPFSASDAVGQLFITVPFLAFPIVGALIASKRPENPIGWICLVAGLFWWTIFLGVLQGSYELARTGTATSSVILDVLFQAIWVPPVGLLGIYMILLFPDGRLPSRRWRPLAWFSAAVMALICITFVLVPGPLEGHPGVRNPLGLEAYPWLRPASAFVVLLLPACILASALSLVLRYRRSGREVREQIKWLAFAASFVGVVYFGGLITQLLFAPDSSTNETPLWVSLEQNLLMLGYAGIPVAVGFAVLKYRLYDIDILINRALVYGSLTVMLATVYVGSIVVLQTAFRALTGQDTQLAVVASTLAIAALFNPLRRRVQAFIDRRFYRSKYDARKTLEAFSAKLRDETDLDSLYAELITVVRETMQPENVSLWLRPDTVSPGRDGPEKPGNGQTGAVKDLQRR